MIAIPFDKIDWAYDLWLIRFWRIRVGLNKRLLWYARFGKCEPCGGRTTFSFSFGKLFGVVNCRDARGLVPPPKEMTQNTDPTTP